MDLCAGPSGSLTPSSAAKRKRSLFFGIGSGQYLTVGRGTCHDFFFRLVCRRTEKRPSDSHKQTHVTCSANAPRGSKPQANGAIDAARHRRRDHRVLSPTMARGLSLDRACPRVSAHGSNSPRLKSARFCGNLRETQNSPCRGGSGGVLLGWKRATAVEIWRCDVQSRCIARKDGVGGRHARRSSTPGSAIIRLELMVHGGLHTDCSAASMVAKPIRDDLSVTQLGFLGVPLLKARLHISGSWLMPAARLSPPAYPPRISLAWPVCIADPATPRCENTLELGGTGSRAGVG